MYRTEIAYDREVRDYAMYVDGELVGFAHTYHETEITLAQLVSELMGGRSDPPEPGDNPDEDSDPSTEGPSQL